MKWRMILSFALALDCVGCIAYRDVGDATDTYRSAPLCCTSFEAMTFDNLKIGSTNFSLDEKSLAFAFPSPEGKSYFKAFALPITGSGSITVRSTVFSDGYPSKGFALFFPELTLLDQNKRMIASVDWVNDHILHKGEFSGPAYVQTKVDLSSYPSARFVIVHTNATRIGTMQDLQSSYNATVSGPPYFATVDAGGTSPAPAVSSPIGPSSLVIEVDR